MPTKPWKAPQDVIDLMEQVRSQHHTPRLVGASIGLSFDDSKPFVKNKINLGRVTRFSELSKLWQFQRHDFCIVLCSEVWYSLLIDRQREAYLDLQLTRCEVEYKPVTVEINGRKKVVKDQWGRVEYTDEIRTDESGEPFWKVVPLDIEVITRNVRRYGPWLDALIDLKEAIKVSAGEPQAAVPELV